MSDNKDKKEEDQEEKLKAWFKKLFMSLTGITLGDKPKQPPK